MRLAEGAAEQAVATGEFRNRSAHRFAGRKEGYLDQHDAVCESARIGHATTSVRPITSGARRALTGNPGARKSQRRARQAGCKRCAW
jgi:hypothetical protein